MAVARLVMQEWKDCYDSILKNSKIIELLNGLYVDDGRTFRRMLKLGERYCKERKRFVVAEEAEIEDIDNDRSPKDVTRVEILKAMISVNGDLSFTMELCDDFEEGKLPTFSFSVWQEEEGLKHTYYEKSMRNQTLLVERTSMSNNRYTASLVTNSGDA